MNYSRGNPKRALRYTMGALAAVAVVFGSVIALPKAETSASPFDFASISAYAADP